MSLGLTVGNLSEAVSGRRWNVSEVNRQVARRTARLKSAGVMPEDRVLLPFGNRLEFFAELLAVWRLGACAIPIDSRLTPFEIQNLARAAKPRVAIVDETTPAEVDRIVRDLGGTTVEVTDTGNIESDILQTDPNADALIL